MKTYTLILKGIDALDIPNRRINKVATTLVKKLCRDNPAERLGCQVGGIDDMRKHRYEFFIIEFYNYNFSSFFFQMVPRIRLGRFTESHCQTSDCSKGQFYFF